MATIMKLFSRRSGGGADSDYTDRAADQRGGVVGNSGLPKDDVAAFETLGETQQSIAQALGSVIHGFAGLHGLGEQMASLKADLAHAFEDHRKLALANSAARQDRDHIKQRFLEKSALYDEVYAELTPLRSEMAEVLRRFEKTRADLEGLDHRHHLLGVAKKEVEDLLARTSSQLSSAQDETEGLRMALSSLQETADAYGTRVGELTNKYNDVNSQAVLLSNRCEMLEASLQEKVVEALSLKERFDHGAQEKDTAILYSHQKEQEVAHTRAEMARMFQQSQQDKKARDSEVSQLRVEQGELKAHVKMLEEIHAEAKHDNEQLSSANRRRGDQNKQLEVSINSLETNVARLTAKLVSTSTAKNEIEQSRATMAARLEVVSQTLGERESVVNRLEREVARLSGHLEKQGALSQDTTEILNARIFELEKEMNSQRNETAFYASQLEALQRPDARGAQV